MTFNYVHGSVKATIDAYDGTVHLYRTEVGGADDPILEAWEQIFPGLIEPIANMPADLSEHLLYPPDLLTVQTSLLGRYHVSDAETLFNGSDRWSITPAPGEGVAKDSPGLSQAVSLFLPTAGEMQGHWVAIRPYGPGASTNPTANRDFLSAIAIADHDDPERLVLLRLEPRLGRQVSSPLVAQSAIDTDPELARTFTLLNANGSAVQFGPMTPLPLDGAMVWARPIIVTGTARHHRSPTIRGHRRLQRDCGRGSHRHAGDRGHSARRQLGALLPALADERPVVRHDSLRVSVGPQPALFYPEHPVTPIDDLVERVAHQ